MNKEKVIAMIGLIMFIVCLVLAIVSDSQVKPESELTIRSDLQSRLIK